MTPCADRARWLHVAAMKTTLVPMVFLILCGCSGGIDSAPGNAQPVSSSAESTTESSSATSSTSAGGATGEGGSGGQGGGGGAECVPDPNPCDAMPGGTCWHWVDSCGAPIICEDACGIDLLCNPDSGLCECADASNSEQAIDVCKRIFDDGYLPWFCGNVPSDDVPEQCVITQRFVDDKLVWCCPN